MKQKDHQPFEALIHRLINPIARVACLLLLMGSLESASAQAPTQAEPNAGTGPVHLRQPAQAEAIQGREGIGNRPQTLAAPTQATPPMVLSEFETYVRKQAAGASIRRLGLDLIEGLQPANDAADYNPLVPPDYLLRAGDELVVTLWGSIDADLRLQVDRSGRISIPRIGPVMVSGVRYADLPEVISRRVALVFKNFQLSVSLGQLRGLRVYVTGFVNKPGAVTVNSLSTMAQALMRAGGPSPAGSYRNIQLRRGNVAAANFDLYDLLLKGDRTADQLLQADDVIHVGPIGNQIALIGSVNRPAVFEIKPGETIEDVLRMAGGFNAVADNSRLALVRLDSNISNRLVQVDLPSNKSLPLSNGDVLRAFNAGDMLLPMAQQRKRVRIEGEVVRPGEYVMPNESTLADALRLAGGLTSSAFLYGAEFSRQSVRVTQQQNYERALRDLETDLTRSASTTRTSTADEAAGQAANTQSTSRLIERLRAVKPTGRVVLQLPPSGGQLPEVLVEDGDQLYIPPRPTSVGVFGSVFNTGSYLYAAGRGVIDYLNLAGGSTRGADDSSIFVIRANGSVVSSLEGGNWLNRRGALKDLKAEPGDTIFVPEEMNKTTFIQNVRDWTQIFFQLGVGAAGLKTATGY